MADMGETATTGNANGWRRGVPTREVAEAQVQFQAEPDGGPVCVFQARCAGAEGGICTTLFGAWNPRLKRWQWSVATPHLGQAPDGKLHAVCETAYPTDAWEFRPVHLWEGDPLPWREPGPGTAVDWSDYRDEEG